MPLTAAATLQTIWDCRWSRPGYRVTGVEEQFQPEKLWVCVRGDERRGVTEEECGKCPHWADSRDSSNDGRDGYV